MTHLVLILFAWLGLAPLGPGPTVTHDDLRPAWDHSEAAGETELGSSLDPNGVELGPGLDPTGVELGPSLDPDG